MAHPLALFSLLPLNSAAKDIVNEPQNSRFLSTIQIDRKEVNVLDVGHVLSTSQDRSVLATIGRNGDIVVPKFKYISKIQCSFEVHPASKLVMFYDRSHSQTTQILGGTVMYPFEFGRSRKVVVMNDVNTVIGIGGIERNRIQFQIIWNKESLDEIRLQMEGRMSLQYDVQSRMDKTVDVYDTLLPTGMVTRAHTPGQRLANIRSERIAELGSGSFGNVYKAVNMDTGDFIAVKVIQAPTGLFKGQQFDALKREIENHSNMKHEHIVEYLGTQDWDMPEISIFTALKQGTLDGLVENWTGHINHIANPLYHQMLQALDYLACSGWAHRDIKPPNILYEMEDGKPRFFLADLGLSNRVAMAKTQNVGTSAFMAPEIACGNGRQTAKVDVWSLFVTLLWTVDAGGFRAILRAKGIPEVRSAVRKLAISSRIMHPLRPMGRFNPELRASAAQMLVKHFRGEGMTTPRHRVPSIPVDPWNGEHNGSVESPLPAVVHQPVMPLGAPVPGAGQSPQENALEYQTATRAQHRKSTATHAANGNPSRPRDAHRVQKNQRPLPPARQNSIVRRSTRLIEYSAQHGSKFSDLDTIMTGC